MRTATQWLNDYGDSHRNRTNKIVRWICVRVIAWCLLGFLWPRPFPSGVRALHPLANWGSIAVALALLYYAALSIPLALGALPFLLAGLWSLDRLDTQDGVPLWSICLFLFVAAWIGQFIGHAVEGKRPSFFKDVQFLMIGPLCLLADLDRRPGCSCYKAISCAAR